MKKTLKELLDERALKLGEADNLSLEADKRELTADERDQFKTLTTEIKELDAQVQARELLDAYNAGKASGFPGGGEDGNRDTSKADERALAGYNLNRAILFRADGRTLDGVEAEVQKMTEARALEDGIELSGGIVVMDEILHKRGQTVTLQTTNPGDQGGVLVEKKLQGVLELLQANTFLDEIGATFMYGLKGDLSFPVQETTPVIQELTEIEQGADSEVLFSNFEMKPSRRFTNVPISRQLLIQSSIDIQNFVLKTIAVAFAQKLNAEAIANLLTIITSGNGNLLALGTNGAVPTYENIVALEGLVDAYNHKLGMPKYLTNTKVRSKLKTTQIFTGTSGVPVYGADNILNGYEAVISNIVPSNLTKGTSNNASAIIFGNFKDFMVGMWGGTEYIIDPYTQKKKAQIEVTANAFWGMKAARVKSFAGIKDALTA